MKGDHGNAISRLSRILGAKQNLTLGEWRDRYMWLYRQEYAETTARLFRTTFDKLAETLGDPPIDQVSRADAATFRASLTCSEQTIRKHIRNCKRIFAEAVDQELIERNPFDRQKASPVPVDRDWHYVDLHKLEILIAGELAGEWRALFGLLRLAGLRLNEAHSLRWEDIDWKGRTLMVRHQGAQTTKKRRRIVPIVPRLYEILRRHHARSVNSHVVGMTATGSNRTKQIKSAIRRAGLAPWPKPAHTLRKNCETDWLAEYPVMDVCQWMGHDPSVAMQHYHQTRKETIDRATNSHQPETGFSGGANVKLANPYKLRR